MCVMLNTDVSAQAPAWLHFPSSEWRPTGSRSANFLPLILSQDQELVGIQTCRASPGTIPSEKLLSVLFQQCGQRGYRFKFDGSLLLFRSAELHASNFWVYLGVNSGFFRERIEREVSYFDWIVVE